MIGVNDLIEHGKTGWLCPSETSALRQTIVHLMESPQLRSELGGAARQIILDRFTFEHVFALEKALLHEVLDSVHGET